MQTQQYMQHQQAEMQDSLQVAAVCLCKKCWPWSQWAWRLVACAHLSYGQAAQHDCLLGRDIPLGVSLNEIARAAGILPQEAKW